MAKIVIHNPVGPEVEQNEGTIALPPLRESGAAVLENGKQNAEFLMTAIVEELAERYGVTLATVAHTKVAPTPKEMLDEVVAASDWVLVGSAD